MDFGRIVGDAWRLTWRHRFLWWFAALGGAQGGSCGGGNVGNRLPGAGSGGGPGGADVERVAGQAAAWVADHVALVALAVLVVAVLGLGLLIISFVARGALIASSARVALGEPTRARDGWALGRRFGWRYVRLTLLLVLAALAVGATVGIIALLLFLLARASQVLAILLGVLLGLAGLAALIALGIGASIVVAYAERAIALDDLGARAGLRRGIALLRLRLGTSLLVWLVGLILGIGVAIAVFVLLLIALVPLGGVVLAAYLASGISGSTVLLGVGALLVLIALLWAAGAIGGTFTSSYWTLAYLSLTGRYPRTGDQPATSA